MLGSFADRKTVRRSCSGRMRMRGREKERERETERERERERGRDRERERERCERHEPSKCEMDRGKEVDFPR